jgi:hypothetical protein
VVLARAMASAELLRGTNVDVCSSHPDSPRLGWVSFPFPQTSQTLGSSLAKIWKTDLAYRELGFSDLRGVFFEEQGMFQVEQKVEKGSGPIRFEGC